LPLLKFQPSYMRIKRGLALEFKWKRSSWIVKRHDTAQLQSSTACVNWPDQ